jgi:LysR family hydrogen peroxide-inducible transcriptional activator
MMLGPYPFTLRQIQYAVAVAESLSFRKAAERCHVSQPSLSAQLAQMEAALGMRLFERDRRRVLLTANGREIIERARTVLREIQDVVELARCCGDPLAGSLQIGVIPTISPYLLPALTPALHGAFPRLTILWLEERTDVLVRLLEGGSLDAALLALEADVCEVEREVLGSDPFVLATPAGHRLGTPRSPAMLSDLKGETVLLLDDGHCFREQALAVCSKAKATELEFRATSLSTLAQVVAAGVGVTLLPALAAAAEAKHARLSLRPFREPAPKRTLALVWRPRSPLGPSLRRLASTAREAYCHLAAAETFREGPPRQVKCGSRR